MIDPATHGGRDPDDPVPVQPSPLRRAQSYGTLLVALAAIGLTVWEGLENRRHNRLSVQPRLAASIQAGRSGEGEYVRLAVENNGLGPAVISSFRVFLDGRVVDDGSSPSNRPWGPVIEAVPEGTGIDAHSFGAEYFFPAGDEAIVFEARRPPSDDPRSVLADLLPRIAVDICYCSIYGTHCDRTLLTTGTLDPGPCPK